MHPYNSSLAPFTGTLPLRSPRLQTSRAMANVAAFPSLAPPTYNTALSINRTSSTHAAIASIERPGMISRIVSIVAASTIEM